MIRFKIYTIEQGLIETNNIGHISGLTWHREDGPARISYYANGNITHVSYWVNNSLHRLDGPAVIEYDEDGNIIYEVYYINGCRYTKENYYNELLKLKVQSL